MAEQPQKNPKALDIPEEKAQETEAFKPSETKDLQADAGKNQEIQLANPDRSDGSAGGDPDMESVTINSVDETGKRTVLASRKTGGTESDFQEKFNANDSARDLRSGDTSTEVLNKSSLLRPDLASSDIAGEQDAGSFRALDPSLLNKDAARDSANAVDNRPIREFQPEKTGEKTYSLGLSYDQNQQAPKEFHEKLGKFFEAAGKRAADFITDPEQQAKYLEEQKEKFVGIGIGLNDAKEALKDMAKHGWTALTDGTVANALTRPIEINGEFVEGTQKVLTQISKEMAEDPHAVDKALGKGLNLAANKVIEASKAYSDLPPREKGRIIGLLMFEMINPEGTLEAPALIGQTARRGTSAAKEAVQVAAGSGTVQEVKANLHLMQDLVKSDEFKDFIAKGLGEALDVTPQHQLATLGPSLDDMSMKMFSGGGDSLFDGVKRKWRHLTSDAGRIESRTKRYREGLEKAERSPFVEGLDEVERKNRVVDWILEEVPEGAEHYEHYQVCRKALFEHPEFDDIVTLLENDHIVFSPNHMEDVAPKLAKTPTPENPNIVHENLPAITDTEGKYTIISKQYRKVTDDFATNEPVFCELSDNYRVDGAVRHELGQSLNEYYGWTNHIFTNPALKQAYFEPKFAIKQELKSLNQFSKTSLHGKQRYEEIVERINYYRQFENHISGNEYGLEQTLADLYAIDNGGSVYPIDFDEAMSEEFDEMLELLRKNNWYRSN